MRKFKNYVGVIFRDLFQVSLVTYLILLLLEIIKAGFVSFFFDTNILLWVTLVSGVVMVLTFDENEKLTTVDIGKRVWHYFFTVARGKVEKDSKWGVLFKEIRAEELLNRNFKYIYKDWMSYARELELKSMVTSNLSIILREISLKRVVDRDWESLSKKIGGGSKRVSEREIYFIFLVSLGGASLIFYKTGNLGKLSLVLALLTFIIVFLLSYLVFTEE